MAATEVGTRRQRESAISDTEAGTAWMSYGGNRGIDDDGILFLTCQRRALGRRPSPRVRLASVRNAHDRRKPSAAQAIHKETATLTNIGDWIKAPLRLPAGHAEIVVGDVHGCREQLEAVLEAGRSAAPDAHLTLLGDLADRGPDSVGAIRTASEALSAWRLRGLDATFLPGNHEQMLLGAVLDTRSHHSDILLRHGGLWAYDLCERAGRVRIDSRTLRSSLETALGENAWAMLTQDGAMLGEGDIAPTLHRRVGNVLLVHAGVHPEAADPETWIETADPMGLDDDHPLWIRDAFLRHAGPFGDGLFVVHGHTPECRATRRDGSKAAPGEHRHDGWRLGLDGGSSRTGIVSAAVLQDGRYRIVTCHGHKAES